MLLRRVAEHVRQRDWFAVAVDFLIVVVGVFVGLQASIWNEARLAEADEMVLLDRIIDDVTDIEYEATQKLNFLRANLDRVEALTVSLRKNVVPLDGDQLALEIESVLAMPGTVERSATFLELLSGGMRRISDDKQREGIVRHDIALLDAKEFQAIRRQFLASHSRPLHKLKFLLAEQPTSQAIELAGGNLELRLALLAVKDVYTAEHGQLLGIVRISRDTLMLLGENQAEADHD